MKNINDFGIAYLRVSSDSQEQEGHSLVVQEKEAIKKLTSLGVPEKNIYIFNEGSHTGTTTVGRYEFEKAIDKAIEVRAKYFWVYSTSRLAREVESAFKYYNMLSANGTKLIASSMEFDNRPEDTLTFGVNAVVDEYYSKRLSLDVKKSHTELKEQGIYPYKAPLGYKNYRNERNQARIRVDEEVNSLIADAFNMYASGELNSLEEIAEFFYQNGYRFKGNRNSNGSGRLSKQTISRILNNPFYYGKFEHNGRMIEHIYPALVSEEIFVEVQSKLKKKVTKSIRIRSYMINTH